MDIVILSLESLRVLRLVLEIWTPVEFMEAASAIGMCPPPRIAKGVEWMNRVLIAHESSSAFCGAKMHAGPSHADGDQETGGRLAI
jgi:hypothetical protein